MKNLIKIKNEANKVTETIFEKKFSIEDQSKFRELDFQDAAIIGLLEDMIGKTTSLITLIEAGNHNVIDAVTRMIFENYVYIKFILERDSSIRGKSYIFSQKIKELSFFDSIIEMSLLGSELRQFLDTDREELIRRFSKINDKTYRNELKEVYLNELKIKKMNHSWYNFNGKVVNFYELCKYLKLEKEYKLIYKLFSSEVHANEALKYFKFEENLVHVFGKEIDVKMHQSMSALFLMNTVKAIYAFYGLKSEIKKFESIVKLNYLLK